MPRLVRVFIFYKAFRKVLVPVVVLLLKSDVPEGKVRSNKTNLNKQYALAIIGFILCT